MFKTQRRQKGIVHNQINCCGNHGSTNKRNGKCFPGIGDLATVVMVLFSALTISSLLKKKGRQRKNHSSKKDYFRTPLFPLIPIAYIGSALFVSWGVIRFYMEQGSYLPALGFLFIGIGSGIYWVWKKFGVGKPI